MRVPSVGLTLEEYRIVREGYELAEHLMRDYQDPPGPVARFGNWLADCRRMALDFYRVVARD